MTRLPAAETAGLLGSLRRLARTMLGLVATRLQILATEIEEERVRFAEFALILFGTAFAAALAILFAVFFVVVALWDSHRLAALGGVFVLFVALALLGAWWLRHRLATRPKLFASTLAEIAKDVERLKGGL